MIGKTAGKYRIVARLGRGSMGTVYRAMDETLHREVAIKVLNAELGDPAARRRFLAEAVAIARLNHPGIAKIYELFEFDGQWLMAMELLPGETLEALVQRDGPMAVQIAADLTRQALSALEHAHGLGVIHRDLKPANLMVAAGYLKITDFGIARVAGSERLTSAGLMMGTPAYMAPEQVLGHDVDARADLFAIGCVLFHMCTAKLPFKGDTPMALVQARLHDAPTPVRTMRPDLPEWLDQILLRALARTRDTRFSSAAEFRDAIERGLTGRPVPAAPASTGAPADPIGIGETILPGSFPVPPTPADSADVRTRASSEALTVATSVAVTGAPVPVAAAPGVTRLASAPGGRTRIWLLTGLVIAVLAGLVLWLRPAVAPPVEPTTTDAAVTVPPAAVDSAAPPPAPDVVVPPATSMSVPVPTPISTAAGSAGAAGAGGSGATGPGTGAAGPGANVKSAAAPAAAGRRAAAPDPPVTFGGIKMIEVTDRRGADVDAALTFGGGRLTVAPTRAGAAEMSLLYGAIAAATFTKDRQPRWAPDLAGPPDNLELPGGSLRQLGRRPIRNWLVIQGQAWFLILALSDADVDPVLTALGDRSRVKISRPGTRP